MRYCPECKTDLCDDDRIYVMAGVIVGCEHCTQRMEAYEYFDDRAITGQDYDDNARWDAAKDARYGL